MQTIPPRHAPGALAYVDAGRADDSNGRLTARTHQRVGHCGKGGTTVISNSDAGRILDAYIASILKSVRRTCFMPCKVRRSPDEPCTAGPQSLDNSWTKGPRASPAHLQEQCEAFEGPLEGDADKLHQPRGPPSAELRRA